MIIFIIIIMLIIIAIMINDSFGDTQVVVHPMTFAGESWQDKVVTVIMNI